MPPTFDLQTLLIAVTVIAVLVLALRFLGQLLIRFIKVWLGTLLIVSILLLAYYFLSPGLA
ncbi:hypothetical protein SCOR_24735 [Sulfidibacter corallicola]|uniref:Uncharacterized protein n=1 Tax=Sulfidibacter corallicola TaxID=2818388 RepID=A0A8A4U0W5_SULCO|nr:hypothetical protein [Sulfidibacter corallicola]QTD52385.1 hypothetical protein J3U87_07920 [Sulfidibacter corallicola]